MKNTILKSTKQSIDKILKGFIDDINQINLAGGKHDKKFYYNNVYVLIFFIRISCNRL
jgi:hypothetical protein